FIAAALIHATGITGAYAAGIGALLLAAVVAASLPDLPPLPATHRRAGAAPTLRSIALDHWRVYATLGIGCVLVSAVRTARQAIIPLWAEHIGLSAATTSLIYGVSGAAEMLVFYPAGRLMDLKGRRWVAVPSMALMGAALLWMPYTAGATTLLLAALLVGCGNGMGSGLL